MAQPRGGGGGAAFGRQIGPGVALKTQRPGGGSRWASARKIRFARGFEFGRREIWTAAVITPLGRSTIRL